MSSAFLKLYLVDHLYQNCQTVLYKKNKVSGVKGQKSVFLTISLGDPYAH